MSLISNTNNKKINTYERVIECSKCNSINTYVTNKLATSSISTFILCILLLCICIWFPSIGWEAGPFILLIAFISVATFIISCLTKNYTLICKSCNNRYKISKKKYRESVKDNLNN
ncbi:MAG: hypothetical protein ACRC92_23025 [Peptostreptococcaceae bacterium]